MAGAPDLFVVCKNCQSEVSPYITECPYCGQRLRKRAPKLDRGGRPSEPIAPEPPPSRPRTRPGRAPKPPRPAPSRPAREPRVGPRRPVGTIALVLAGLVATILYQADLAGARALALDGPVGDSWWQLLTTSFVYPSIGYEAVGLTTVAVFGWLLERRHGLLVPLLLYLSATVAGTFLSTVVFGDAALALGANGGGLALLTAWAMRDLLGRRRGEEDDADMLGVGVWAAVLLALPLGTPVADPVVGLTGALLGTLAGLVLARVPER